MPLRRIFSVISGLLLMTGLVLVVTGQPAQASATGSSRENPIWVNNPGQVPEGAVADKTAVLPSGVNLGKCETATTWVKTTPGQHHDDTTHTETRWKRVIEGHDETTHPEYRYIKVTPAVPKVTEHKYKKVIPGHDAVYNWGVSERTRSWTPPVVEHKYKKVIPGHGQTYTSWCKYKKTVNYYTVEHKKVKSANSWTSSELNWLRSHATKVGSGADATSEWQLNDQTVNAYNVNPLTLPQQRWTDLPSGLAAYGGPSSSDVDYYITSVDSYITLPAGAKFYQTHQGTVYYTGGDPNTGFSPNPADAVFVKQGEGPSGWTAFGCEQRGNNDAVPDRTVYYLPGGGSSDTNTDANWTTDTLSAPWTQIDSRTKPGTGVYTPASWDDVPWTQTQAGLTSAPTVPANTDTHQWRVDGPTLVSAAVPDRTVYYLPGGGSSDTNTDANWTTDTPSAPWTQIDSRTKPGTDLPEVTEYYPANGTSYTTEPAPPGFSLRDQIAVGNGDAVPDKTVFYNPTNPGVGDTDNLTDANWTTLPVSAGPEGYTFVDSREVSNEDGYTDPDTHTYYAYRDHKQCVVPPPVYGKPSASVKTSCVTKRFGEGVARLNNTKPGTKTTFRIVKTGRDKFVTVAAGKKRSVNLTGLRVGSVVKVKVRGKILAKTRVPGGCGKTPPPDTGLRVASSGT